MAQRDYILRMFEEMSRALAQLLYHRQMKDYQAAHDLIDEQLRQTLGMGSGFLHSLSDETLLAMLTTLDTLNLEKCWLVATLLKTEGDLYQEEQDEARSYYSYLTACNLFLEMLYDQCPNKDFERSVEVEELSNELEEYELPMRTRQLFFWYFERTGSYRKAEELLFDMLETIANHEMEGADEMKEALEKGTAFYARLLGKDEADLKTGKVSHASIQESLARLHTFSNQ